MNSGMNLMMKCDLCYDRTSVGKKPMCASVCPSQALFFGTRREIEALPPRSRAVNSFKFVAQTITTKVNMMIPRDSPVEQVDVTSAMYEPTVGRSDAGVDTLLAGLFAEEDT